MLEILHAISTRYNRLIFSDLKLMHFLSLILFLRASLVLNVDVLCGQWLVEENISINDVTFLKYTFS
jgi:hypothetical protein